MALVPFPTVTPGDDEDDDPDIDDSGSKMSFLEHLDEPLNTGTDHSTGSVPRQNGSA